MEGLPSEDHDDKAAEWPLWATRELTDSSIMAK